MTLNVNLVPCTCDYRISFAAKGTHFAGCPDIPIFLPCPIPPKVEFTVRLGECTCTKGLALRDMPQDTGGDRYAPEVLAHAPGCPARLIHVTCSIGGETWAGSKPLTFTMPDDSEAPMVVADACRARWEIVKALLLNMNHASIVPDLFTQRDAVFEALADLVRLDTQRDAALARAAMALESSVFVHSCPRAEEVLGQYVSHLIAKVSEL